MTLQSKIQEIEEEFDKEFCRNEIKGGITYLGLQGAVPTRIKWFLHSHILSFAKRYALEVIDGLEKNIAEEEKANCGDWFLMGGGIKERFNSLRRELREKVKEEI